MRWAAGVHAGALHAEEARVLVRLLFWLGLTDTGDRAELNLRREDDVAWGRLSAQDGGCLSMQCAYVRDGSCFLHRARRRAEAAHILIVNHALLLSDLRAGGNVLPEYQHLVVDEAHHLEDEATRQFGFTASPDDIDAWLDRLHTRAGRDRDGGLVATMSAATRVSQQADRASAPRLQALATALGRRRRRGRGRPCRRSARALVEFGQQHAEGGGDYDERLQINRGMRVQPDWAGIETSWFETEERSPRSPACSSSCTPRWATPIRRTCWITTPCFRRRPSCMDAGETLRGGISKIIGGTSATRSAGSRSRAAMLRLRWRARRSPSPRRCSTGLFAPRASVVLTSATLSTDEHFDYIKGRTRRSKKRASCCSGHRSTTVHRR